MHGDRLHVFGIRHHGPGSASSLLEALDASDPAIVLIEGPPEADSLIRYATSLEMKPPLALLVHATDTPSLASFFPFAEYSPEWQAMLWALRRSRPVRFIDLPASVRLAAMAEPEEEAELPKTEPLNEEGTPPAGSGKIAVPEVRRDPLGYLAELAGYDDGEVWWNTLIEQNANAPQIFAAIEDAMYALRENVPTPPGPETERGDWGLEEPREAHMRLAIADALKETEGAVAVVTGAWHVPALRHKVPRAEDRAALRNLSKVKVTATWVPWTDSRLAFASGYRAGVISPGWYRHLWRELRQNATRGEINAPVFCARWQANVARLLRQAGRQADTASVIEAARLSLSLAALRSLALPGLPEMREASLATLCQGEEAPLRLIERELMIGTEVGHVDPSVPQMPLQADLSRLQKQTKLKPEALDREAALDLRTDAGLAKSVLLHRLQILRIPWGKLTDAGSSRGTFRERWVLRWEPEFSVQLAEALVYGTTIEQAAGNAAISKAREAGNPADISDIVRGCLLAGLDGAAQETIDRLQASAASTTDIAALLPVVPPLVDVLRYGTARKMPTTELLELVQSLTGIICAGLAYACRNLDAEQANGMRSQLAALDRALATLADEKLLGDWRAALGKLHRDKQVSALLSGYATRTLYDQGALDASETAIHLSRGLSRSVVPVVAGEWLDGFLANSGEILLHDERLFGLIDAWLTDLGEEDFVIQLPVLRRTFESFDRAQRRRLLDTLNASPHPPTGKPASQADHGEDNAPGFAGALPLLLTILGLDEAERQA
jgi:hypothetical protein